ncbi:MAG: Fic family protein [Flavobacteriales bacterium]|nr:Fic family protein [Flavobacteriales bacterium]
MPFNPKFIISPALTLTLLEIEESRTTIANLPITIKVLESLRESARLMSTHYSTQIEGNRLTQEQVNVVLKGGTFPNRHRDEIEVRDYYLALDFAEELINKGIPSISEEEIQTIHGLVMNGKRKATPYRDGQNVIRDSSSGAIIYLPPEASDVPVLMSELIAWVNEQAESTQLPIPIIAAIAHYQFATIHPYYDGNGRTARLLTSIILHKSGYGLKGIFSLEEYYADNLQAYYKALTVGDSHNYYFGRENADITQWVEYFCIGLSDAFAKVRHTASIQIGHETQAVDQTAILRELDLRQKKILSLFRAHKYVTTSMIASKLGIQPRAALNLCNEWITSGFIQRHGNAKKNRNYSLSEKWESIL